MRNVFACLVHERPECVADLVANLRRLDPSSEVLLYNGGPDPGLLARSFAVDGYEPHVHPAPRPLVRGRLHEFGVGCMEHGLERIGFDALTVVDSDQLLLREGWSAAIGARIAEKPSVGLLCGTPERQPPGTPLWTPRQAYRERALWEPLLQRLPGGREAFGHWAFWPGTVFTASAAAALVERVRSDRELAALLERTRIWATEEVVLPMLVVALGFEPARSPDSGAFLRYRARFGARDLEAACASPDAYWIHPVPRRLDHSLRRRLRARHRHTASPGGAMPEDGPALLLTQPILERMRSIEGWLLEEEADLLIAATARAVADHPGLPIVEVGSYCGRSTTVIGGVIHSLRSTSRLYAIDPHEGVVSASGGRVTQVPPTLERFRANVHGAGLDDVVVTVRKRSYETDWRDPIGLLLIDGLHDRENVSRDFHHFAPYIPPGGYVAFHDYASYWPDVVRLVDEVLAGDEWRRVHLAGSLMIVQRAPAAVRAEAEHDLVSCVMPTGGRPALAAQAVACFLAQDHVRTELIVVDDGEEPLQLAEDPRIRVLRVDPGLTIGAKRNLAAEAAHGRLIAHWDDDDWYAPWRLSRQLDALLRTGGDICGLSRLLYYEPATDRAWRYAWPRTAGSWLHDATLLYTRELWRRQRQPDVNHGLDTRLLWNGAPKRTTDVADERIYVGMLHAGNTSTKNTGHRYWSPVSVETVHELVGSALDAYRGAVGQGAPA